MLLETVHAKSDVTSIAVIDMRGLVVAGSGPARELAILGAVAASAATGPMPKACERLTEGTDVLARPIAAHRGGPFYLAALGTRVTRMSEAARGVERILAAV